ncbi:MAG: hypothetical protein ABIE36_03710 [Candidatus Diapherotrites archaeon]
MTEKLEEKTEKRPKILNDLFREREYEELKRVRLYEHYIKTLGNSLLYSQNFQITFTP